MNCGLIDLPCHVWNFVEPFWGWVQIAFWVIVGMALLWGLAKVKELFGWPGLAAAVAALAALWGYRRGRKGQSLNPLNNRDPTDLDGADADPPIRTKRTIRTKATGTRRRFNHDTGQFENY